MSARTNTKHTINYAVNLCFAATGIIEDWLNSLLIVSSSNFTCWHRFLKYDSYKAVCQNMLFPNLAFKIYFLSWQNVYVLATKNIIMKPQMNQQQGQQIDEKNSDFLFNISKMEKEKEEHLEFQRGPPP